MSTQRDTVALAGVAAAACAVCCTGPIVGFLAAIGVATFAGFALFGAIALAFGAIAVMAVLRRHRRRAGRCHLAAAPVAVEPPTVPARG